MEGTIFGNLIGTLYFLAYILCGVLIADTFVRKERFAVRAWLGVVFGLLLLAWLPALFAFAFKFTIAAHLAALALLVIFVVWARIYKKTPNRYRLSIVRKYRWDSTEKALLYVLVPFMAIIVYLLFTHTIPRTAEGITTGQSTYGDMVMHLGFITSVANQGFFPPEYSILYHTKLSYPFLCDTISSSVYIWGSSLVWAYNLPMYFAFASVFAGLWNLMAQRKRSWGVLVFAFLIFFVNGGFGILYFIDGLRAHPTNFTRMFTDFYISPTNFSPDNALEVDQNIRWVNVICDMLIPQRATLFGWSAMFASIWMLVKAQFDKNKKYFIAAALLTAGLPMIQTHAFLAVGIIAITWFLFGFIGAENKKEHFINWAIYGAIALVLAVPQLLFWTFGQAHTKVHLDWLWGKMWLSGDDLVPWFWIKNVGMVLILLIPAFFTFDRKKWLYYSGAIAIFLVAMFFQFQPNLYDNNKLLYVWYLFTVILVAEYCAILYHKLRGVPGRKVIATFLIISCTISGGVSIFNEAYKTEKYFDKNTCEAVDFINAYTPKDSMFLTSYQNYKLPITSLTGRSIIAGSDNILYYHGLNYADQYSDIINMYLSTQSFEANKVKYGVDYVWYSTFEYHLIQEYNGDSKEVFTYLQKNYRLIFQNQSITIFAVSKRAIELLTQ